MTPVKSDRYKPMQTKILIDGREASIWPRIYNTILVVGRVGALAYDEQW